jgi:hypothetical protein
MKGEVLGIGARQPKAGQVWRRTATLNNSDPCYIGHLYVVKHVVPRNSYYSLRNITGCSEPVVRKAVFTEAFEYVRDRE